MANTLTDGFSPGDDDQVVGILKKWQGGPLSDLLFTTLARMLPQPCVETVVLRRKNNSVQVLLVPRPPEDITWPGMLHSPGQALRAMDFQRPDEKPMYGPFERVQKNEIKADFIGEPEFVGVAQYSTRRGPEAVHVYLAQIAPDTALPENVQWCDVDKLPEMKDFIQHQLTPIRMAVEYFNR
jgi:hypothetical protein